MLREIIETDEGLELQVDGSPVALIRARGGALDLVWSIRGPKDLDTSRQIVCGLIDLLIQYDVAKGHTNGRSP